MLQWRYFAGRYTTSLGSGDDTVKFTATAAANGTDTISGFSTGNDSLDASAFMQVASTETVTWTTVGTTTENASVAANSIYYFDKSATTGGLASDADVSDVFGALFGTTAGTLKTDVADSATKAVIVVKSSTAGSAAGTNLHNIYFADASLDSTADVFAADDIKLVGTVDGTVADGDININLPAGD